jgi:ketosteroid isomerase-like protein
MTDDDQRTRNGAAFARSLAALSNGDLEGHLAGCCNDFLLELPYADPPISITGKEAVRAYLTPALATFSMRLDVTRFLSCADPDFLIAEYTSEGHVTTTNKPYANSYIAIVRFRGDLIRAQREYYNPVPAARALVAD